MKQISALIGSIILVAVAWAAFAQDQTPAGSATAEEAPQQPGKVSDFLNLLKDPEVRKWLESQPIAQAAPADPETADTQTTDAASSGISAWEDRTRARIDGIVAALPRVPAEILAASARTRADALGHGYAPVFIAFSALVLIGAAAEALFVKMIRRRTPVAEEHGTFGLATLSEFVPTLVFAGAMAVVYFGFAWPPLARVTLLAFLIAFVAYRLVSTAIGIAMPPTRFRMRIRLGLGILLLGLAFAVLGPPLDIPLEVREAISYLFSIALLLVAVETVRTTTTRSRLMKVALTIALAAIWLLWSLDLPGLFWLGIYALVLPGLLASVGRIAATVAKSLPNTRNHDLRQVLIARGSRAVVIGLAVAWLAVVWQYNTTSLAKQDPTIAAILFGLVKSVAVLVVADLLWNVVKALISRQLEAAVPEAGLPPEELAHRGRLRTLLPIFRNGLAALVLVMVSLTVLSQLGVEIGPLIAGAGIFGVALGFGSQTLVKDVISGVFYMLDDAFRVGEYIQSGSYKGTVESFSLRSVRLRHHRGPVFTVPFGELGAVQNMSRDWVIDKFRISVGYDTDINKARKIAKAIGAKLLADPEVGSMFIEPLKMKGVEEFGDYGIVLGFGMTVVPGQQTYIRRKAYAMIREAFGESGIEFAQPSVQVGGDDKGGGAAAAAIAAKAKAAANPAPAGSDG